MKKIILLLLFFVSNVSFSQSFHANLKATGLTCAMCSYSTQRSLEKLDFISTITPDLEATSFLLEFRDDMFIDFDLIQEKVEDAGFFVGEIEIVFSDEVVADNDLHSVFNNNLFHFFTENKSQTNTFKLVDKSFVPKDEFSLLSDKTTHSCYMTGKNMADCCKKHDNLKSNRIFHLKSDI